MAAVLVCAAPPAAARSGDSQKARVVVAPLSTLGADTRSNKTLRIEKDLLAGLSDVPGFAVVGGKQVRTAVKKAKRPDLRTCDGDVPCLAALGALMKAQFVIYGELGGLGDAQFVALKVVEVSTKRELRSTTAQFEGANAKGEARAAGFRLLAPSRYVGTLTLKVDVEGATIYLDGNKVATSPSGPVRAEVGNHALRVTHPEYRDFVRFVDLPFDQEVTLDVPMLAFPIVDNEMRQRGAKGGPADSGKRRKKATPWYSRWYTIAGAGAVLAIGSAIAIGMLSDGIDADREETVGN